MEYKRRRLPFPFACLRSQPAAIEEAARPRQATSRQVLHNDRVEQLSPFGTATRAFVTFLLAIKSGSGEGGGQKERERESRFCERRVERETSGTRPYVFFSSLNDGAKIRNAIRHRRPPVLSGNGDFTADDLTIWAFLFFHKFSKEKTILPLLVP